MLITSDRERLNHILDAIDKIAEALMGLTYESFYHDWQKCLVIERLLEIIGEAANRLSLELRDAHPQIPWPQIIGMRNLVSHEYFRIDTKTIWVTAIESVPKLRSDVEKLVHESSVTE